MRTARELLEAIIEEEQKLCISKEQINADVLVTKSYKLPMFEMPMKDQVGYDINIEDFPKLIQDDLQSQIDTLVEYVDRNKSSNLKGYKTINTIRHVEKIDNLNNKTYGGDVYLTVGNCYPNTNKIIQCNYEKQLGLYHMKNGKHWNDCKDALSKDKIAIFQKCNDIDYGIDRDEHEIDKTKLEVHTGEYTYIIALARSKEEETTLLTVYKETTKERNTRRRIELTKGRQNRR